MIVAACKKIAENTEIRLRLILVPHEPTSQNIDYIKQKIQNTLVEKTILLSEILECEQISKNDLADKIVIVDSIGKLLKLYGIADMAYIGGAFGVGVHSITEPAGYGIPLVTGTNCFNSPDSKELLQQNALAIIENSAMLYDWFIKIYDVEERKKCGIAAQNYIKNNCGSTKIIAQALAC